MKQNVLQENSKKIKKSHGNRLLTPEAEETLAIMIENYLRLHKRPKNVKPIWEIMNNFIQKHAIDSDKRNEISMVQVYRFIKKHQALSKLYYRDDENDSQTVQSPTCSQICVKNDPKFSFPGIRECDFCFEAKKENAYLEQRLRDAKQEIADLRNKLEQAYETIKAFAEQKDSSKPEDFFEVKQEDNILAWGFQ
jgi:hypothetical protein